MNASKLKKNVYWTGAVDWTVRNFHGHTYRTSRGTTYNAYLVVDEKIALIDTVADSFGDELTAGIEAVIPGKKIDYIIANHVEDDHSGALPALLDLYPQAEIIGTSKCREGLMKHYFKNMSFRDVKTGDSLSLGSKTLRFIEAPMLHWPDSMFTYLEEDRILFPNDAFGQHYASGKRFDGEVDRNVLFEEAKKYYANILWPFSKLVLKKIEELTSSKLQIDLIAPSHGIIWRDDPLEIVKLYSGWAANETKEKVVIVYETMWGATEKIARGITEGIIDAGVEVKLFDVNNSDRTEVIGEMLDARGFLLGSSTHGNTMLPGIASFLHFLKGMKPSGRIAGAFGSYGWGGGAVKEIEKTMAEGGMEVGTSSFGVKYRMNAEEEKACREFGKSFAKTVREKHSQTKKGEER